jgi:hypothetical protein
MKVGILLARFRIGTGQVADSAAHDTRNDEGFSAARTVLLGEKSPFHPRGCECNRLISIIRSYRVGVSSSNVATGDRTQFSVSVLALGFSPKLSNTSIYTVYLPGSLKS